MLFYDEKSLRLKDSFENVRKRPIVVYIQNLNLAIAFQASTYRLNPCSFGKEYVQKEEYRKK